MNQGDLKKLKSIFTEIINKNDPWDLISGGAPSDEYNKYTDRVISYVINKHPSVDDLKKELLSVFSTNEFELSEEKMGLLAGELMKSIEN